jgi:hypothetical protein
MDEELFEDPDLWRKQRVEAAMESDDREVSHGVRTGH